MTELSFKGKEFVYNHHLAVPFRPLVPDENKGIGPVALDGNLIIHGDNLHALKALLPLYAGKVDCIFIDPPYNTGTEDWSYNDNVNAPMIKEWLESNPVGIEDGLRHDKWCAMMWPRLRMLSELLSDEGIIFICIDDNEAERLKAIASEIFGPDSFITQFVWRSRVSEDTRSKTGVSNDHEYVLCFGGHSGVRLKGAEKDAGKFANADGDERGPWRSADLTGLASKDRRPNLHYDLIDPETDINYGCPPKGWRFDPTTMAKKIAEKRVLWPSDPSGRPRHKLFEREIKNKFKGLSTLINQFNTGIGTREITDIMGEGDFEFPKSSPFVQFFLDQVVSEEGVVLDSFAGTGTTAHAVLEANRRDGGNRRFILVEMEDYADRLTAERVRRVINGYDFKGTQKAELLRERLNWRAISNAAELVHKVEAIENLHGHEYDRIKKEVKDGELIVTGEKTVAERAEGLGGTFTYCTLGAPVELDKVLSGETLPPYAGLGAALFHMATNHALDPAAVREDDFYLGATEGQHVWLIYKPDLDWLKSPEAALTLARAKAFAASDPDKRHLVFAPARFVSQKMLAEQNIPVEFVPLPFALYRIDRS
ncbi:site-specific DNA-methyltransferase [Pseudochelatococcus sp. G4_1912]|uniref:site-specific DNA-methyltransferase n=1 Tax=Pseudochelatococcus sp. G4_1912 TaxID=3114288 RepID=UPI0039C6BB55